MRVGVIQSSFLPWRGYFDFIDDCDLFIFYDDLQFSKGSWRNRNKIKTPSGSQWITVPVIKTGLATLIQDTLISDKYDWQNKILAQIKQSYQKAKFFDVYFSEFEKEFYSRNWTTISELNQTLTKWLMNILGIETPLGRSSEYQLEGKSTERLINLLKAVGAKVYLSGPAGGDYLEKNKFLEEGVALEYKSYDYEPYPQLHGEFEGAVTVLDLLFNVGQEARRYLKSRVPNEIILPR